MLKVGLIGCGFMGAMHANCYKNIEGVKLVAFADIRREKADELAKDTSATIYGDGKDLIANADVDIIDICLPTFLHAEYAMLAMEKVKYVFVEKPVALTVAEGKAMLQKSRETGCQVQVGQVIRFGTSMWNSKKYSKAAFTGKSSMRISAVSVLGLRGVGRIGCSMINVREARDRTYISTMWIMFCLCLVSLKISILSRI